jgi:hypothetical protein
MLKENESKITDHDGKADILWKAFKERMGTTENLSMKFNLHEIFGYSLDRQLLDNLESSFFDKEIEDTIKQLPNEKSPGPDGFNNEFIKACWPIIGSDIKGLIQDFYEEKISLESINDSLITLIPKSESPTSANDFRPISLLNSVLRILTKLLSNRLQKVILKLVHKNQYGFLKKGQFMIALVGHLNIFSNVANPRMRLWCSSWILKRPLIKLSTLQFWIS